MAAIFPLDTAAPWTFNGVTYEYDASDDRWYVISTNKTDQVDESLESLDTEIDAINETIDQEIENRTNLLDAAADKNNQQDAELAELDQRIDAVASAVGTLAFKGEYKYVLEKTDVACQTVQVQCILAAGGDAVAIRNCQLEYDACVEAISEPYPDGSFTTKGTTNEIALVEEFILTGTDLNGQTFDWLSLVEVDDYLEFFEEEEGDTALYQVVEAPQIFSTERSIRVKFLRETGEGDGRFNLDQTYDIRVFKAAQGLDLTEADNRYVIKPYVVYFADSPGDITPVAPSGNLRNGELWFDTSSLELFVYNNNAWVASSPPPSQDIVIQSVIGDVDRLLEEQAQQAQRVNSLVSDLLLENNIYYGDNAPTGDITGTLRNGDLWVDSDDLTLKFYSGGAWINPDRQVGGDYISTSGGTMTGPLNVLDPTENTHAVSRGYANTTYLRDGFQANKTINFRTGGTTESPYKITNYTGGATLFKVDASAGKGGPVIFKSDNDCYQEYAVGGIVTARYELEKYTLYGTGNVSYIGETTHEFTGKVNFSRLGDTQQGFKIEGRKTDGTIGELFFVYHNGGGLPDAVNYNGKIGSGSNIVNKQYVDDRIAELEARITALGG